MEVAINNAMSLRALYCVILFTIGSGRYIRCIDGFVVTTTTTTADFIIKNRQQQSVRRTGRCSHILSSSSKTSPLHETPTSAISREGKEASSSPLDSSSLKRLGACKSSTQAKRLLEKALIGNDGGRRGDDDEEQTVGALYGSVSIPSGASSRGISDGDLAIQTRMVNKKYKIMDLIELSGDRDIDRASASLFGLFIASTSSAIVVNENFPGPEILRFVVVLLLSFLPLAFVGYGLSDADKLQALLVKIQREVFPVYRKRMIQHEAGHFLIGHLLGFPVKAYATNAVKNAVEFYPLSDGDRGMDYASRLGFDANKSRRSGSNDDEEPVIPILEDRPFFSKDGRGGETVRRQSVFRDEDVANNDAEFLKLPSLNEPTNSWPYRGFKDNELDQLCAISVAGVCAEILAFGDAEGGVADLSQLRQIFNSAEEEISEREYDNRIRYGLGFTISLLRRHLGALDALADVMERGGCVAECVIAIESCGNVSGQDGLSGDYEFRRRQKFRTEGATWVEKLFVGKAKNADTEEDRFVEGKGGGYIEEKPRFLRLTGDDPLYAALAVSLGFLVWASSGGLSLH